MTLAVSLADPSLFTNQCFVDGQWCDADSHATFDVYNPFNLQLIDTMPNMTGAETTYAIAAAQSALPAWQALTAHHRAALLMKWHSLIMQHQEDLALILTTEQGKPLTESRGEINYAADFIVWYAEQGKRLYGDVIPSSDVQKRLYTIKQPIGVVAAITPWNFPAAMVTRKLAPALAAGCTMVLKPASATPFTATALVKLAQQAGIPDGVLNLVVGDTRSIGSVLTQSPIVKKLSFTGSTAIGKQLMADCAATVKKLSLELGGNAPFIVCEDADLDAAIRGAIDSKFRNGGQTCICANRFYVHASLIEKFAEKLRSHMMTFDIGDGRDENTFLSALINEDALIQSEQLIADATSRGAKLLYGGTRHDHLPQCFMPTILSHVTSDMAIVQEEIFAPIVTLQSFEDDATAIKAANDTEFGLASYVYSRDIARITRYTEQLEYGMVGVNTGSISNVSAPFGGIKSSGIGREGSYQGIEEYIETKYICMDIT